MEFIQIASYDNFMLANMAMGLLKEHDIDCHLKDENTITIDPLLSPALGGIKLMVEKTDFPAALVLIHEAEETYLKEIPCPACRAYALGIEEKVDRPESFWGKLKNQIAYGQTSLYSKYYRCGNCRKSFTELPPSF